MQARNQQNANRAAQEIGSFEVKAVSDGILRTSLDVLVGLEQSEKERLAGASGSAPIFLPVNCFLFELGSQPALIDVGAGNTMGPTLGKLPENLRALGVPPESIRYILLTHLHPDHSNGLVDANGRANYPNAEVIVHEREAQFWFEREARPDDSERVKRDTKAAKLSTAPYRDRIRKVGDGAVLPGVSARLLAGHTPGHTGWLLHSGDDRLLIWGDIVHLASVQVPRPDATLVFDVDQPGARQSRIDLFDWMATERIRVAGAHLKFPGFAHIIRTGSGYAFQPQG